jgi:hypothetical protein
MNKNPLHIKQEGCPFDYNIVSVRCLEVRFLDYTILIGKTRGNVLD